MIMQVTNTMILFLVLIIFPYQSVLASSSSSSTPLSSVTQRGSVTFVRTRYNPQHDSNDIHSSNEKDNVINFVDEEINEIHHNHNEHRILNTEIMNVYEIFSSMSMSMPSRSDSPSMIDFSDSPSMIIRSDPPSMTIPSDSPSTILSDSPSIMPSDSPSMMPSDSPSMIPSDTPSMIPSDAPSMMPSDVPSLIASDFPLLFPRTIPSTQVKYTPIAPPTKSPSANPSSPDPNSSNSPSTSALCGDDEIIMEQHNATTIPLNVLSPTSSPTTSNILLQVGLNDNSSAKATLSNMGLKSYGMGLLIGAVATSLIVIAIGLVTITRHRWWKHSYVELIDNGSHTSTMSSTTNSCIQHTHHEQMKETSN